EKFRAFAARGPRYKLVQPLGVPPGKLPERPAFHLYDLADDPYEQKDLAAEKPDVVERMKKGYDEWFADVSKERGFDPPRIHLGAQAQPRTVLTRQDWRGPQAGWGPKSLGYWEVHVAREGRYDLALRFPPVKGASKAGF